MNRRAAFAFCTTLAALPALAAVEEPVYATVKQAGDFELRRYAPMVVAETFVDGDLASASSEGFRVIAGYIFGNNESVNGAGGEKVAMTAPVTMEPVGERVAMTAPVNIEAEGDRYRMHFVMPAQYTMDTLPRPRDARVRLRQVPAGTMAVARFSGFSGEQRVREKTAELLAWLKTEGLEPAGAPQLARYDPPWILPFFRRNEIMVPVEGPAAAYSTGH